jgi:hypothetical protein
MANVIRLDKVKGYPVSFENSIENLEQGLFLELKGLSNGDYEAYEVELAKATPDNTVVFHASVVMQYDERLMEQDFVLANGKVGRAFIPERGDIITVAESIVNGSVEIGNKLGCVGDGKLGTNGATKIARVLDKENFGGQPSLVIEFI